MHLLPTLLSMALLSTRCSASALHLDKRYNPAPFKPTKCAKNAKPTATPACLIPGLPNPSGSISISTAPTPTSWAKPPPSSSFQVILQNNTEVRAESGISIYDIDIDSSDATFASLLTANKYIVCYFSAGTAEDWRGDFGCFNHALGAQDLGCNLGGPWPNEFWLNTTSTEVRKIMQMRIQRAADRGCSAVDPDNIDGYSNRNGIGGTKQDSIDYIKFLSAEARSRGMGLALKNSLEIVPDVINDVDFAVNEQCIQYDECNAYEPFWALPTPLSVFNIEYPPHNGKTWKEKDAEKKCNAGLKLGYEYLVTDLKNYPTVDCGVARCAKGGPVPQVPKAGLVIPEGCVNGS